MQDKGLLKLIVEQITAWCNINSGSWNLAGLQKMHAVLTEAFSPLGDECKSILVAPFTRPDLQGPRPFPKAQILTVQKRPAAPLQVMLVGHYDTVFEANHAFQQVTQKNGTLNGPGVADMKGGICLLLHALQQFEQLPEAAQLGWKVVLNPDEELGSQGSMPSLLTWAPHFHVALIFEPAITEQGGIVSTRKGSGNFVVTATGKAAHAGRDFDKGKNAIVGLAELITRIQNLNHQNHPSHQNHKNQRNPGLTINVGRILGGTADNIVPPEARCSLNVRIVTQEQSDWFFQQMKSLMAEQTEKSGIQFTLEGNFARPPKTMTTAQDQLFHLVDEAAAAVGQTIERRESGGSCDGNNLLHDAHLPNIDTLGVCGGGMHSDQEFGLIDTFIPRINLIVSLLKTLARHHKDFHANPH